MDTFLLHRRLAEDTALALELPLCSVLLMDDATVPWLILVPRRSGVREIHELERVDRLILMEELALASKVACKLYSPDKLNVGALGNIVEQLHIHVVSRFKADRAWPGPVWGADGASAYAGEGLAAEAARVRKAFEDVLKGA